MKNSEKSVKYNGIFVFNLLKDQVFFLCLFSFLFTFISCKSELKDNSDQFKIGVFEIPSGKSFVKETIIRKDSIQISKHGNEIDTLSIKWKNNFFYTLRYINPKTELQKDPMFIQINKIHKDSYDFTVKIGFSKFKNKGTMYKLK